MLGNKRFHLPGALLLVVTIFFFICHHALSISTPDELNKSQFHSLPVAQAKGSHYSTDSDPAKHAIPAVPAIPAALPPTGVSSSPSRQKKPPFRVNTIDVDDVALLLYTDASVIGQRLPIHLVTSLLPERIETDNVLIYSNRPDTIGDWRIVDVFENSTTSATWTTSTRRKHNGHSQVSLSHRKASHNSDNKFLPLLQHAGRNKPHAKWYIYMEDDSYIFLTNLLHHLSTFSWEEPWYIAPPETSRRGFFALSRTAWEQVFGAQETEVLQARFASALDDRRVLDRVLKEDGVLFGAGASDAAVSGESLQSHRASAINRENWCAPVYSWHDASGRDISRLRGLELNWHSKRTLQHRDIYTHLIADEMSHGRIDWPLAAAAGDRHASEYEITANDHHPAGMPHDVGSTAAWQQGWQSADACETACALWPACVQWSFVGGGDEDRQRCRVDRQVVFTFVGDGLQSTSGWMASRIDEWAC